MSSHYIYVQCPAEECPAQGSIYTGGVEVEGFPDDSWEGRTIMAECFDHSESES